jgi:hypothetical protein
MDAVALYNKGGDIVSSEDAFPKKRAATKKAKGKMMYYN